jgi:anti-sigma B factor antagonist
MCPMWVLPPRWSSSTEPTRFVRAEELAVIVGVLAMARAVDREIGAVGLTEHYKEVFEITRLADFMHIYQDSSATT